MNNAHITAFTAILSALLLLLAGIAQPVYAENDSGSEGITVDFSTGLPYYFGDFNPMFDQPEPYQGIELANPVQYNNYAFAASLTLPMNEILALRLRAQMASLFFIDSQSPVNFRNTAYDFAAQVRLNIIDQRLGWYIFAGPGLHTHFDTGIYETEGRMQTEPMGERITRLSLQGGSGLEFSVIERLTLFAEVDWMLTGSDRFDGYNGRIDEFTVDEREEEQSYFLRDQLVTLRGGIRLSFSGTPDPVPERAADDPVSSWVPPPDTDPEEPEPEQPDRYDLLGIQPELSGITIGLSYALNLDELRRQREVATRILSRLTDEEESGYEILATTERFGYSLHLGTFETHREARQMLTRVSRFYSTGSIIEH